MIHKLDRLKSVIRQSDTLDGKKKENSAEHSWQCTMMALLFRSSSESSFDMEKVLSMLVLHDVGEIDAGDVSLYSSCRKEEQYRKELCAVESLFLKTDPELVEIWKEFEEGITLESKYARAIDRIAGLLSSHFNETSCWNEEDMTVEKILEKNRAIQQGLPSLWANFENLVFQASEEGKIGMTHDKVMEGPGKVID